MIITILRADMASKKTNVTFCTRYGEATFGYKAAAGLSLLFYLSDFGDSVKCVIAKEIRKKKSSGFCLFFDSSSGDIHEQAVAPALKRKKKMKASVRTVRSARSPESGRRLAGHEVN